MVGDLTQAETVAVAVEGIDAHSPADPCARCAPAACPARSRGPAGSTTTRRTRADRLIVGATRAEQVDTLLAKMAADAGASKAEAERGIIDEVHPTSLLKRLPTSEEVANIVVYRASPRASATNGAALRVEGGGITSLP